jgi:hypothetical protein
LLPLAFLSLMVLARDRFRTPLNVYFERVLDVTSWREYLADLEVAVALDVLTSATIIVGVAYLAAETAGRRTAPSCLIPRLCAL